MKPLIEELLIYSPPQENNGSEKRMGSSGFRVGRVSRVYLLRILE